MKTILKILAALTLAPMAFAADYMVFRVCEDHHIIRTSDGQEAGHVEYIIVDRPSQRIVSTILTGGVIGERLVPIPFVSLRFRPGREVALEFPRERLMSAPPIERTRISTTEVFDPALIERTSQHFGVRFDVGAGNAPAPAEPGRSMQPPASPAPGASDPNRSATRHEVPRQSPTTDPNRPATRTELPRESATTDRNRPGMRNETPREPATTDRNRPATRTEAPREPATTDPNRPDTRRAPTEPGATDQNRPGTTRRPKDSATTETPRERTPETIPSKRKETPDEERPRTKGTPPGTADRESTRTPEKPAPGADKPARETDKPARRPEATGEKPGGEKPGRKPEHAMEKATEKGERITEKVRDKTDKDTEKTEKRNRPPEGAAEKRPLPEPRQ